MNLSADALEKAGYVHFARYDFDELIYLVASEIRRPTPHIVIFYTGMVLSFLLATVVSAAALNEYGWSVAVAAGIGVLALIVAVPVHELLHALAFRLRGAHTIRFGAQLSRFIFYAVAHHFVATYREMLFILYLPALTITLTLAGVMSLSSPLITISASWLLFVHCSACTGDCALASYMWRYRHLGIVTGDEDESLTTHFYIRAELRKPLAE